MFTLFGKISLVHFNPAVTIGYYITGHISKIQILYYFAAEIIGALLGSLFVMKVIGEKANLGANAPNYDFSLSLIFPVEVLASALFMGVIFYGVCERFSGVAIGGIVGLDILFLAFIQKHLIEVICGYIGLLHLLEQQLLHFCN